MPAETTAVVLCGGASSRMGRDKGSLPFGSESVLARVVRAARGVTPEVVLCGARAAVAGAIPVEDAHPGRGPMVALLDVAARLSARWLLVIACDMPLIEPDVLRLVRQSADGHDACAPRLHGRPVPTCAAYLRPRLLEVGPPLEREGRTSLQALLDELDTRYLDEEALQRVDPHLSSFTPCNTPAEYRHALALAGLDTDQA